MIEIRLYYECLEQANDYLLPLIRETVGNNIPIRLIKCPKKAEQFSESALFSIMSFTTPDALITAVKNNIEYPLAIIEFTEAVITEDHELQRTYGALAACLSDMYYIKISGKKESNKVFGGAEYNPFSTPKILIEQFNYECYVIAEWQTNTNNPFNLQKDSKFPACPPEIPILKTVIQTIIKSFLHSEKKWLMNSVKTLKRDHIYQTYRNKVDKATGMDNLLNEWQKREDRNKDLNKLRYFVREDWIGIKINRFNHAMDPDRGIINFVSFVFSETHKIYGIYALVRPRGNDIMKQKLENIIVLRNKVKEAIVKDKGGIPTWFSQEMRKIVQKAKKHNDIINIQYVWEKHKDEIAKNKVVQTIAFLLDGLYLNYNGIKLVWNRRKLLGNENTEMIKLLKDYFSSAKFIKPLKLTEETNEVNEDEVTYALLHRVLIPNKFKIISVSYPGSQGGNPILPNPKLGKSQPREYLDLIALPPIKNKKIDILLNESKGMFNQSIVQKDISKITRYKNEISFQTALKENLLVAQVIDRNDQIRKIIIGVSFGVVSNKKTFWKPSEVDFIFRIEDRKQWAIGIFNQALRDLIPKIEGKTNFPKVYKLLKE